MMRWWTIGFFCLVSCAPASVPPEVSTPGSTARAPVKKTMWAMAATVRMLDHELATQSPDRDLVLKLLNDLLTQTGSLDGYDKLHPILWESVKDFGAEIRHARDAVTGSSEPAEWGNSVVGACASCHDLRECPFGAGETCIGAPIY